VCLKFFLKKNRLNAFPRKEVFLESFRIPTELVYLSFLGCRTENDEL